MFLTALLPSNSLCAADSIPGTAVPAAAKVCYEGGCTASVITKPGHEYQD